MIRTITKSDYDDIAMIVKDESSPNDVQYLHVTTNNGVGVF